MPADDDTPMTDDQMQDAAQEIGEAFCDFDLTMLAQLTPQERAVQAKIRRDLYICT
ncbi:hypothetical protein [Micromonospora sp. KC207]|uniref:hypothetical protein n=1 Tax=Micromonospora sp. KC207 TaxID=2530377 RepID=UPI0014050F29|nr:hypothetical protein [Micromonospora sp. KC207]